MKSDSHKLETGPYRAADAQRLGIITSTLCLKSWDNKHLDADLLKALDDCLIILEAAAFVGRYDREGVTLKHATRMSRVSDAVLDSVAESMAGGSHEAGRVFHRELSGLHIVGTVIFEPLAPEGASALRGGGKRRNVIVGHAALCFYAKFVPAGADRERMITFHGHCTSALLWQVLQQRVRVFLPVAPRVAERYWLDARKGPGENMLVPPWDSRGEKALRTVTLGFDLRKSTFCMENADDPKKFAYWLDDMVQILMHIAHYYGGIFDKFTGDGALVHFPVDTSEIIDGRNAVTAAVFCSIAMQKGMAYHLGRLRKFLRLDSKVVGGAIGIDVALAHWTLDERDNPITVGRGVVNACRLMDGTKAGCVRLTNIAYHTLDNHQLKRLFVARPFTSKEFGPEMGIVAWELQNVPRTSSFPLTDERVVAQICETVWKRRGSDVDSSAAS